MLATLLLVVVALLGAARGTITKLCDEGASGPSGGTFLLRAVRVYTKCFPPADSGLLDLGITGIGGGDTEWDCDENSGDVMMRGYTWLEYDITVPTNPTQKTCTVTLTPDELAACSLGGVVFSSAVTVQVFMRNRVLRYFADPNHLAPVAYRRLNDTRAATGFICDYSNELCAAQLYDAACFNITSSLTNCIDNVATGECVSESRNVTELSTMPSGSCFNSDIFPQTQQPSDATTARYLRDRTAREVPCRVMQYGECAQNVTQETRIFLTSPRVDPDHARVPSVDDAERFRVPGEYDTWVWEIEDGDAPSSEWGYVRFDLDIDPYLAYGMMVNGQSMRGRRTEGCDTTDLDWDFGDVCTGAPEKPQRNCNCADFPSQLDGARVWVARDERDDFLMAQARPFLNAPEMGGMLIVKADFSQTYFEEGAGGIKTFTTDSRFEQNVGSVSNCANVGGDRDYADCDETRRPRFVLDGLTVNETKPVTWFHGFPNQRRLRVGHGNSDYGMHPGDYKNTFEDVDAFPLEVLSSYAQQIASTRIGSTIPAVDFWSGELGDPSRYPDTTECMFDPTSGDVISNECSATVSVGVGSSRPLPEFQLDVATMAAAGRRSVHLPPATFTQANVPDAWFGRAHVGGINGGDQAWPKLNNDDTTPPALFVDRRESEANDLTEGAQMRYQVRISAKQRPFFVSETGATLEAPDPSFEPLLEECFEDLNNLDKSYISVHVCNTSPVNASFILTTNCGLYAEVVMMLEYVTEPIEANSCAQHNEKIEIRPFINADAPQASCLVTAINNIGRETATFTTTCSNSSFVTPPPTPPPPTPPPPTTGTPPPTPPFTTSNVTATPPPQGSNTAWIVAAVIAAIIAVGLVIYLLVGGSKTPDQRATLDATSTPIALTMPVKPTPALVANLQQSSEFARLAAASAPRADGGGTGVRYRGAARQHVPIARGDGTFS